MSNLNFVLSSYTVVRASSGGVIQDDRKPPALHTVSHHRDTLYPVPDLAVLELTMHEKCLGHNSGPSGEMHRQPP